jgi:small conductance mechanosensitive channel
MAFGRIAIIVCVSMLAACASHALEEPDTAKREESRISIAAPPDRELEARLAAIYAEVDGLQSVDVRVRSGIVHLAGVTETVSLKQRASHLAQRLEGVVDVVSDVRSEASGRLLASTWHTMSRVGRRVVGWLPLLVSALLVFAPFALLAWVMGRWHRPLRLVGVRELTGSVVSFVLRSILLVSGFVLALEVLGLAGIFGAVLGTLGLLGLVAGVAFKDWVANYFPALMLGFHPPFKAGDLVHVGPHEGRVVKITPRATILMTTDGEQLRLPNAWLFQQTLVNLSYHRERRLRFTMMLETAVDLRRAQEVGVRAIEPIHGILDEPPPFMRTRAFGRGTVEVEYYAWVDQSAANFRSVESRARRAVFEALVGAGVPLAADTKMFVREVPHEQDSAALAAMNDAETVDAAFVRRQFEEARGDSEVTAAAAAATVKPAHE